MTNRYADSSQTGPAAALSASALKALAQISLYGIAVWEPDEYARLDDAHFTAVNKRTVGNLFRDGYLANNALGQTELTPLGVAALATRLPIDDLVDRFSIAGYAFVIETRGWPDRAAAEACCALVRSGLDLVAKDTRLPTIESIHTQLLYRRGHPLAHRIVQEAASLTLSRYKPAPPLPQLALRAVTLD